MIVTLFTSILILSYLTRIVERPFSLQQNLNMSEPFLNNVYMTVITMTTVGYGDFSPTSTLGKVMAMLIALYGGFIISLLIVSVQGIFNFQNNHAAAFYKLLMIKKAARALVGAMRLRVMQVKFEKYRGMVERGEELRGVERC